VLSYDEALAHPQGQARGLVVPFEDPARGSLPHLMPPVRLEGTPAGIRRRAPDLGEHDAEIRAWLAAEEG
jgi:formyl-CoA transferase